MTSVVFISVLLSKGMVHKARPYMVKAVQHDSRKRRRKRGGKRRRRGGEE